MCTVEVAAPLLRLGIGFVVKVQVPPLGRPELHDRLIAFGMAPVGVRVIV
jgi:hypothetical protein